MPFVTWLRAGQKKDLDSIPSRVKRSFSFPRRPNRLWCPSGLLLNRYQECVSGVKRQELEADHSSSSSSSIGITGHCGLWPVEQYPTIFFYPSPTFSIYSLPALVDLFLLPLSIFSLVFPFFSSFPVLE